MNTNSLKHSTFVNATTAASTAVVLQVVVQVVATLVAVGLTLVAVVAVAVLTAISISMTMMIMMREMISKIFLTVYPPTLQHRIDALLRHFPLLTTMTLEKILNTDHFTAFPESVVLRGIRLSRIR